MLRKQSPCPWGWPTKIVLAGTKTAPGLGGQQASFGLTPIAHSEIRCKTRSL